MPSLAVSILCVIAATTPTNLEMAEQAVVEALQELPEQLLAQDIDAVRLEILGEHAGNWLIEEVSMSVLSRRGIEVTAADRTEGGATVLRLRPMDLSIAYSDVSRAWLVGSKKVTRHVSCELSATAVDSTGMVLMASRLGHSFSDRIHHSDIEHLQGTEDQAWLSPEAPESGGGGLLEPLVVSGVVASLIYLFYSSRAE